MSDFPSDIDFIFITQTRWDGVPSTSFAIAQEVAKTNRVYFIDKPYTIKDALMMHRTLGMKTRLQTYLFGRMRVRNVEGLSEKFRAVVSYLTVPVNWLPRGAIYNFFLKRNRRRMERLLVKLIAREKIGRYVLFNSFNPFYTFPASTKIKPFITVYQCVDNIAHANYLARHGAYLELEVIPDADILLATSKDIIERFKAIGHEFIYLPNAANTAIFTEAYESQVTRPPEIKTIDKPIIGYLGGIDSRTDYQLLARLAARNPDKVIVLIGPRLKVATDASIGSYSNVKFIGFKKMHELPAFVRWFDCAIIPFCYNEFTRSIYPLKINEYLAAGRPVVTTRFSDDISSFESITFVCDSHEQFLANVDKAILENTPAKERERIAYARGNSWAARTVEMFAILHRFMKSREG